MNDPKDYNEGLIAGVIVGVTLTISSFILYAVYTGQPKRARQNPVEKTITVRPGDGNGLFLPIRGL